MYRPCSSLDVMVAQFCAVLGGHEQDHLGMCLLLFGACMWASAVSDVTQIAAVSAANGHVLTAVTAKLSKAQSLSHAQALDTTITGSACKAVVLQSRSQVMLTEDRTLTPPDATAALQDLWFCETCKTAGREQLVRKAKAAQLAARATARPTSAKASGSAIKAVPRIKRRSGAAEPASAASAASKRAEHAAVDTSR